jgi:RNA polymerase sigma-70 factor, ECF subfamily
MRDSGAAHDARLVDRAIAGDVAARGELLDRHRGSLRQMIALRLDRRVATRVDPSDVVQEVLQDAHQRLPEYLAAPRLPFYLWLRRITCDRLVDVYRTHIGAKKRSVLKEQACSLGLTDESVSQLALCLAGSSIHPDKCAIAAERRDRTAAALLQLKSEDREILLMRYVEQLKVEEIAKALAITPTAVTTRHLRALQRLRRLMGNEGGE